MNRWARIQTGIAGAGTLAFAGAGAHGWLSRFDPAALPLHAQLALLATLTLVLAHSWIALYALACRRRLPPDARARRRAESQMVVGALAALAASGGHFLLAGRLFVAQAPGWIHGVSAVVTLLVLVVALAIESRALGSHQREAADLAAAREAPHRVLDSARS